MAFSDIFMVVPNAAASVAIWFVLLVVVFYFARQPAHYSIRSFARILHNAFRVAAYSVLSAEQKLQVRNREVLLAAGREAAERMIEREFERVEAMVHKDLAEYPALQRQISEQITRIGEDYEKSTDVPPDPPAWSKAVEAVANIPAQRDSMVGGILEDIHASLAKAQARAIEEYRKASLSRHKILKRIMPHWQDVEKTLHNVDKNITSLIERSKAIGRYMDEYEEILKKSDNAVRVLSASSLTQFFVSALVLVVAIGGAMINFTLIARPMAEMVGGHSMIMGYKTSEIAALVIILVEVSMGLFLMESLRITRLFPVIGALNDKLRVRMIWITFSILLILASVEAGLAFMREILLQDELATSALLRGDDAPSYDTAKFVWITTAAQMGMGFILPFALVFVAIPLETFVHSLRAVLGLSGAGLLRFTAVTLRLTGNLFRYTGGLLVNLYDLFIFAPLWLEGALRRDARQTEGREQLAEQRRKSMSMREVSA